MPFNTHHFFYFKDVGKEFVFSKITGVPTKVQNNPANQFFRESQREKEIQIKQAN